MSAQFTVGTPPRGGGTQNPATFVCQSFTGTKSWGSNPASWTIVYIGSGAPIQEGAEITAVIGEGGVEKHRFWGLCKTDMEDFSSADGLHRRLSFVDFREYLNYDDVFGAFNMADIRIVEGRRVKRYWHIYPSDFLSGTKTFTDAPLTAAQVLNAFFNADTVLSDWTAVYHPDMESVPVYGIDCQGGRKLGAVLQEVSDRLGLVFTIAGGPYRLVWARKGESGVLPPFPPASNNRAAGRTVSGNPTAVYVLGSRNAYQLMAVALVPDWAPGWEAFIDLDLFVADLYERASDPRTGVRFNAVAGDATRAIGWQLAAARAREMQVWEYVELRGGALAGGAPFVDHRMYHGRSRMDMPCALYIRDLLFRAFRPNLTAFTNWYGELVNMDSVELANRILTDVWHDPVSGEMFWNETVPLDGNGYAIIHGYQVGADMFRTLKPENFDITKFTNDKKVWEHVSFQTDDSGEGVRYLIFDQPVIVSDNLFLQVDGLAVINAQYTLTVPPAKAALVVEAERFRESFGTGDRFVTASESELYRESVRTAAGEFHEVPFADGATATEKAGAIADSLLAQQYAYWQGGFRYPGIAGYDLTDMIDRVTIEYTPRGRSETVDWTGERQRNAFEPERAFDRALRTQHLLPGQEELRHEANQLRLVAAALRQNPGLLQSLGELVQGPVGPSVPLKTVIIEGGAGQPPLPVGSVLRKKPMVPGTGGAANTDTNCVLPTSATADHKIFEGVTVRQNENPARPVRVQFTGEGLARVKGPVTAGGMVGLPPAAENNLVASSATPLARALKDVAAGEVKLIPVFFGGGGGGGDEATWV